MTGFWGILSILRRTERGRLKAKAENSDRKGKDSGFPIEVFAWNDKWGASAGMTNICKLALKRKLS